MRAIIQSIKNKRYPIITGIMISVLFVWLLLSGQSLASYIRTRMNNVGYDIFVRYLYPKKLPKDNPVVIVDIDEKSIKEQGSWPWPRDRLAKLIIALQEQGVIVVALDLIFSKAEPNPVKDVIKRLDQFGAKKKALVTELEGIQGLFNGDQLFAQALKDIDSVLGFTFHHDEVGEHGTLPKAIATLPVKLSDVTSLYTLKGYTGDIKILVDNAKAGGFVTTGVDDDGILRRIPLVIQHRNKVYASLALQAVKLYFLEEEIKLNFYPLNHYHVLDSVSLGKQVISTDALGQIQVPFYGRRGTIKYISATDVLEKRLKPSELENRVVFIGSTLLGFADFQATPVESIYPGIEVHASVASGMIQKFIPSQPIWMQGLSLSAMMFICLIAIFIFPSIRLMSLSILSLVLTLLLLSIKCYYWFRYGYYISMTIHWTYIFTMMINNLIYAYLIEGKQRRQLRDMFSSYVPPEYAHLISETNKLTDFEGDDKVLTIMFVDIVNFTTLSESLSAREIKKLLYRYLTPMTEQIFKHRGTIDKYIGDTVMSFWGAPLDDAEHRRHACLCALALIDVVQKVNKDVMMEDIPPISIKVGLNTGVVSVGDMGSEYRRAYTVIGDPVNAAARMEASTRSYGVDILVGEETAAGLDEFAFRMIDKVVYKGKTKEMKVYELIAEKQNLSVGQEEEIFIYDNAIEAYFSRDFNESLRIFRLLLEINPDSELYHLYIERNLHMIAYPPDENWTGVYQRRIK